MRAGKWLIPLNAWKNEPCFIVGGGASIRDLDCGKLCGRGRVIAVNDAGLYKAPFADVMFWADKRWYEWNHDKLHLHTGAWKVSRAHAQMDPSVKTVRFLPNRFSHWQDALGGWCSGSSCLNLAYLLGASPIFLLGFDMRDLPLDRWQEGNWHNNHKLPPQSNQRRLKFIPAIEMMAPYFEKRGLHVYNCNKNSGLRCFPFVDIEEVLAMTDIRKIEREKYMQVWQFPEYRKVSPGILDLDNAWLICSMQEGESLIDYGAGPARATLEFQRRGLKVTAVDIAPNARETNVPYVEACLWELPTDLGPSDWAYCTDVMEHIPTDKVDCVLSGIAARTTKGAYFRIATRPDKMGPKLLRRPLHLSVYTGEWWRRKVEEHFPNVDVLHMDGRDVKLLARGLQ